MRIIGLIVASLVAAASAQAQNISIATGGTGGVYYPLGGGMANVLSKFVDRTKVLERPLAPARQKYDFIFLDTAPAAAASIPAAKLRSSAIPARTNDRRLI